MTQPSPAFQKPASGSASPTRQVSAQSDTPWCLHQALTLHFTAGGCHGEWEAGRPRRAQRVQEVLPKSSPPSVLISSWAHTGKTALPGGHSLSFLSETHPDLELYCHKIKLSRPWTSSGCRTLAHGVAEGCQKASVEESGPKKRQTWPVRRGKGGLFYFLSYDGSSIRKM